MTEEKEQDSRPFSQVTGFVQLFQLFGRSSAGLLLLEAGWTVILVLVTKLTGEEEPPEIAGVPLTAWWVAGCIVIAFVWVIYSGLYIYLLAPLLPPIKFILNFMVNMALPLACILDFITKPLVNYRRRRQITRWIEITRNNWIDRNIPKDIDQGDTSIGQKIDRAHYGEEFDKKFSRETLNTLAGDAVSTQPDPFLRLVLRLGERFLTRTHAKVRIGLAPTTILSSDRNPIRYPSTQQYRAAIADLVVRLAPVVELRDISFRSLPTVFPVETHDQAWRQFRKFSLDALLWSRLDDSNDRASVVYVLGQRTLEIREEPDYRSTLFPDDLDFTKDFAIIGCRVEDSLDMQVVLITALIKALRTRSDATRSRSTSKTPWEIPLYRIHKSERLNIERILRHLAFEVLPLLPDRQLEAGSPPQAKALLVEFVSMWCGSKLQSLGPFPDDDKRRNYENSRFTGQLLAVLEKCTRLMPWRAEHFYRLAAICCLRQDTRALDLYRIAGTLDRMSDHVDPVICTVLADMALRDSLYKNNDIKLAVFCTWAIRAIYSGYSRAIRERIEKVRNETFSPHIAISILDRILDENIG
jgi:hypothetical protein